MWAKRGYPCSGRFKGNQNDDRHFGVEPILRHGQIHARHRLGLVMRPSLHRASPTLTGAKWVLSTHRAYQALSTELSTSAQAQAFVARCDAQAWLRQVVSLDHLQGRVVQPVKHPLRGATSGGQWATCQFLFLAVFACPNQTSWGRVL